MNKHQVKIGYNKIAKKYSRDRDQFKNQKYLDLFNSYLKPNSTILDMGCGSGKPIDEFFSNQGHKIVGIDISEKQIKLAKKNFPKQNFEVKDMDTLESGEYQVDAVVSFYAVFHVLREKHQELFNKMNSFLQPGGLLLVTMGASEWEGKENFHGTEMHWSHYGQEQNRKIVKEAGFEILLDELDLSGGEKHQILIAKKA